MHNYKLTQTLGIKQALIMDMIVNSSLWGCVEILKAVEKTLTVKMQIFAQTAMTEMWRLWRG